MHVLWGLSVCVPAKFMGSDSNPKRDDFQRWGLWEVTEKSFGWCPEDGVSALTEEIWQVSRSPLPP